MIEVITERYLIRNVARRWRQQYGDSPHNPEHQTIGQALVALETASADDVNGIVGNSSWTRINCDACGRAVKSVVHIGEQPDYESSTAMICGDCLSKALKILQAEPTE